MVVYAFAYKAQWNVIQFAVEKSDVSTLNIAQ